MDSNWLSQCWLDGKISSAVPGTAYPLKNYGIKCSNSDRSMENKTLHLTKLKALPIQKHYTKQKLKMDVFVSCETVNQLYFWIAGQTHYVIWKYRLQLMVTHICSVF